MASPERPAYHLWPVQYAADFAGLKLALFVSAAHRGQLGATEILVLGDRGERFVRASSLVDFLEHKAAGCAPRDTDPFNGRATDEPADLFAA